METQKWTDGLNEEDLAFLKQFVLSSGSLKELAQRYGISYPTVRLRLDRLIEKVKVLDSSQAVSDFERLLKTLYVDGKLDGGTLRTVMAAHRKELEKKK